MSMSWFKVAQRRVKEGLLQAVGAHQGTEDKEFDDRVAKFQQMMRDLHKIQLSTQHWIEAVDAMCTASVKLSEGLAQFHGSEATSTTLHDLTRCICAVQTDAQNVFRKSIRNTYIERVIKPIESILSIEPIVKEKLDKRKNLLLDSDFYKSKLQNEVASGKDATHPTVEKIARKLMESNKALNAMCEEIVAIFDEVEQNRQFMLGPELSAWVACQHSVATAAPLQQVLPLMPQSAATLCLISTHTEANCRLQGPEIIRKLRSAPPSHLPLQPIYQRPRSLGGKAPAPLSTGRSTSPPPVTGATTPTKTSKSRPQSVQVKRTSLPPTIKMAADDTAIRNKSDYTLDDTIPEPPLQSESSESNDSDAPPEFPTNDNPAPPRMERISPTLRPTLSAGPIDIDSVYTCDENTHVEIVTAVYDFAGVESGDLSFVAGETIQVLEKDESGWWTGVIDSRRGIFPSNYTTPFTG